jgi:hypothetical protein
MRIRRGPSRQRPADSVRQIIFVRRMREPESLGCARHQRTCALTGRVRHLSVFPEPLETIRRQRRVTLSANDGTVSEIPLDRPSVVPVIGELVAAGMTQHVAMDQEREGGSHARPRDHPLIACHAQRRAALAYENVDRFRVSLPLQSPYRSHFLAADWVDSDFPAMTYLGGGLRLFSCVEFNRRMSAVAKRLVL